MENPEKSTSPVFPRRRSRRRDPSAGARWAARVWGDDFLSGWTTEKNIQNAGLHHENWWIYHDLSRKMETELTELTENFCGLEDEFRLINWWFSGSMLIYQKGYQQKIDDMDISSGSLRNTGWIYMFFLSGRFEVQLLACVTLGIPMQSYMCLWIYIDVYIYMFVLSIQVFPKDSRFP